MSAMERTYPLVYVRINNIKDYIFLSIIIMIYNILPKIGKISGHLDATKLIRPDKSLSFRFGEPLLNLIIITNLLKNKKKQYPFVLELSINLAKSYTFDKLLATSFQLLENFMFKFRFMSKTSENYFN